MFRALVEAVGICGVRNRTEERVWLKVMYLVDKKEERLVQPRLLYLFMKETKP